MKAAGVEVLRKVSGTGWTQKLVMRVLLCDNVLWAVGAALSADEGSALVEPMPLLPQNDLRKLRSNFDRLNFFHRAEIIYLW
jgi:hypothetical protein